MCGFEFIEGLGDAFFIKKKSGSRLGRPREKAKWFKDEEFPFSYKKERE